MSSTLELALEEAPKELDQEALRAAFIETLQRDGITQSRAAQEMGIPVGTLSSWKVRSYLGDTERVAHAVQNWFVQRQARARTKMLLPQAPGFLMTKTASQIWDLLELCQTLPTMGTVIMASGLGKTTAFRGYQQQLKNTTWIVTLQECHRSLGSVLREILIALNIPYAHSVDGMARSIVRKLTGTHGLMIIDEAQHAGTEALDQIRSLADASEIGFVLGGSRVLATNLGDDRRQERLAQIFSRIGMRLLRDRPLKADIEMMLDAWAIEDRAARELLLQIAMRPGAARVMTTVLRVASSLAAVEGQQRPTLAQVELAIKQSAASTAAA